MAVDSTFQLFQTTNVMSELIDWQRKRRFRSLAFQKSGSQVSILFGGQSLEEWVWFGCGINYMLITAVAIQL
jgi:hypothetical protein